MALFSSLENILNGSAIQIYMKKLRKPKRRPVKPVHDPNIMNMYHPSLINLTEFAFESSGVKYYNFKQDSEQRYGRYVIQQAFLQEYYLRVDLKTLQANIDQVIKFLSVPDKKDELQIGKALVMLEGMKERAQIAFEPDTVYRLASCLFFDDKEILSGYDDNYNKQKIARWREANSIDFFFNKLFQELTGLINLSRTGLEAYLQETPKLIKSLSTMEGYLTQ